MTTNFDLREKEWSITEQAATWHVPLESHDSKRRPEFWHWVTQSPAHVREALVMGLLQQVLQDLGPDCLVDTDSPAVSWIDNVSPSELLPETARKGTPTRWMAATTWIAACAVLGLVFFFLSRSPNIKSHSQTYATDIGEQRHLTLKDGSTVFLDVQSRLVVQLSARERSFYLEGQALFNVAHDPSRPFRVRTPITTIEAVGTEFNVRTQDVTTVSVLDGVISLYALHTNTPLRKGNGGAPTRHTQLAAGEAANINVKGEITDRTQFDRQTVIAWVQQQLVFSRVPLKDIAREFNRYNPKGHLFVQGDAASLRLGGVFDATDPSLLLLALAKNPAVVIERDGDDFFIHDRH
jgi:transmembrane sensor